LGIGWRAALGLSVGNDRQRRQQCHDDRLDSHAVLLRNVGPFDEWRIVAQLYRPDLF